MGIKGEGGVEGIRGVQSLRPVAQNQFQGFKICCMPRYSHGNSSSSKIA